MYINCIAGARNRGGCVNRGPGGGGGRGGQGRQGGRQVRPHPAILPIRL